MARKRSLPLFHVSPARHRLSIARYGLLPCADRRGKARVWLCDAKRVAWARSHVAQDHRCDVAALDVWEAIDAPATRSCGRVGVFWTVMRVRVRLSEAAGLSIQE